MIKSPASVPEQATVAVKPRIQGVFNAPELMAFGPLVTTMEDCLRIVSEALDEVALLRRSKDSPKPHAIADCEAIAGGQAVQLTLSSAAASALLSVMRKVAGNKDTSARGYSDLVDQALRSAGVVPTENLEYSCHGTIFFADDKDAKHDLKAAVASS